MEQKRMNREKGFTILEVVFAVTILAIGIMAYTVLKTSNRYSLYFSKNLSQAIQLTDAQLEDLLVAGYNDSGWMSAGDHDVTVTIDASGTPVLAQNNAVNDSGYQPVPTAGDFTASGLQWTVINACPSQLTKMVKYRTTWGSKSLTLTQVQVRP